MGTDSSSKLGQRKLGQTSTSQQHRQPATAHRLIAMLVRYLQARPTEPRGPPPKARPPAEPRDPPAKATSLAAPTYPPAQAMPTTGSMQDTTPAKARPTSGKLHATAQATEPMQMPRPTAKAPVQAHTPRGSVGHGSSSRPCPPLTKPGPLPRVQPPLPPGPPPQHLLQSSGGGAEQA